MSMLIAKMMSEYAPRNILDITSMDETKIERDGYGHSGHSGYGHSGYGHSGYGGGGVHSGTSYFDGGHSGYGDDCCPLVLDPLLFFATLGSYLLDKIISISCHITSSYMHIL